MTVLFLEEPLSFSGLQFSRGSGQRPHEQQLTISRRGPSGNLLPHWGGEHCLNILLWCVEKTWYCWNLVSRVRPPDPQDHITTEGLSYAPSSLKYIFTVIVYKCVGMKSYVIFDPKSLWGFFPSGSLGDPGPVSPMPSGKVTVRPRQVTSQWWRPWYLKNEKWGRDWHVSSLAQRDNLAVAPAR